MRMSACVVLILFMELICYSQTDIVYQDSFANANGTTITNGSLTIYGYKGHYGSLSTIVSSSTCSCNGAYSCAKASYIITKEGNIWCKGSLSCFKVSKLELKNSGQSAVGFGVNSMSHAFIRASSSRVVCDGEQSCAFSVIEAFSSIYALGAYSLLYAKMDTINTITTNIIKIQFDGHYSGFEASIICRTEHACTIVCRAAYACTNLHINCSSDNCNIIGGTLNVSLSLQDILFYDSLLFEQQNDALCTFMNSNFDSYADSTSDVLDDTYGAQICCRAHGSCYRLNVKYISHMNEAIVCSGGSSCMAANIINKYGSVFCSSYLSCIHSNIIAETIHCSSYESCMYTNISMSSYVYCSGSNSCIFANILSNGTNLHLYLTGSSAVSVICNALDYCIIYCLGFYTCSNMELICDGSCDVYCDADSGCPIGWSVNLYISPTSDPSLLQTQIPSLSPTATQSTTYNPTNHPTENPFTSMPSSKTQNTTPPTAATDITSSESTYSISSGEVRQSTKMSTEALSTRTMAPVSDSTSFWVRFVLIACVIILLCCILAVAVMCLYKYKQDELETSLSLMNNTSDLIKQNAKHVADNNVNVELQQPENVFERKRQRVNTESKCEENNDDDEKKVCQVTEGAVASEDDGERNREAKQHTLFTQWLTQKVKLPQYYDMLKENGFETLELIMEITDIEELKKIGISKFGHVLKFMKEIQRLKEKVEQTNEGDTKTLKNTNK